MSTAVVHPSPTAPPELKVVGKPAIAQILHRLSPAGAEVLAAALARELGDRYRFVFFCLDDVGSLGRELADEGFEVECLDRRPGVDWRLVRRLRAMTRDLGIDLLHAHQYTPFFYAAASRGLHASPRILFTEHGRHYPDQRRTKRVIANKLMLRRRDHVTAVGEFIRDALVANEGIAADRIEVIRNGIEPDRFGLPPAIAAAAREQTRRALGIAVDTPVVLQVARFHPVKDHATGLRAFARVAQSMPDALLLLAGDGDGFADAQALAAELAIDGRVQFLGLRRDIPQLMAAADVFMLSSLSEGLSVTLLEAMGAGLPIVATNVGGNPEVVADGVTGFLTPRGDSEGLGRQLDALLCDATLRRQMGAAGRTRLGSRFTQAAMHEAFARLYGSLILDGSAGSADG